MEGLNKLLAAKLFRCGGKYSFFVDSGVWERSSTNIRHLWCIN